MVRTRFALILYFRMVAHKAACHTLSKAFLKSMKTWYRFCWCWRYFSHRILRLKICSVVLLPALNPACSSAIISSAWGFSLFKMTFSMTLKYNTVLNRLNILRAFTLQKKSGGSYFRSHRVKSLAACHTLSETFLKSWRLGTDFADVASTFYIGLGCCRPVLRCSFKTLNPAYSSGIISSAWD